jgi:hypothetical protein
VNRHFTFIAILSVLVGASAIAHASRVLRLEGDEGDIVVVSQDKSRSFQLNDKLCFKRRRSEVACGEVISTSASEASVKLVHRKDATKQVEKESRHDSYVELVFERAQVKTNDRVVREGEPEVERTVASRRRRAPVETMPEKNVEDEMDQFSSSVSDEPTDKVSSELVTGLRNFRKEPAAHETPMDGKEDLLTARDLTKTDPDEQLVGRDYMSDISIGLSYIFPTIQYQQNLIANLATGVLVSYMDVPVGNGSLHGFGGMLTLNSYGQEPFRGPWFQLGAGLYSLSSTSGGVSSSYTSPAMLTNVGWRWLWDTGVNFGFGVGVQYLFNAKPAGSSLDFSGLLPSIALDLGFAF